MKRVTGMAIVFGLLAGNGALAADAMIYEPPALMVEPVFDWTGPYVGAHAGWGFGEQHDNLSALQDILVDRFSINGFVGGIHVGQNWQSGSLVFGFEGDFDYTDMDGTAEVTDLFDDSLTLETSWQGSLRARMGYAADTWLIYATGGVAVGRAKLSGARYSLDVLLISASDSNTHIGFTAGAGVEKAFTPHWTGRAEVRYTNFGSEDYDLGNIGNPVHSYWHQATATLGISYKF